MLLPSVFNYQSAGANLPNMIKSAGYGRVIFVDSNGGGSATSGGRTPETAVTTIDAGVNACDTTGNRANVVLVAAGHAETIAAAAGVAQDVAGIAVVGCGWGASRPTITFSATDSTWAITAANSLVKNIRIKSSVNELVSVFTLTTADCEFDAVDVMDNGAAKEILQFLLTTSGADNLTVRNCRHIQLTAGASAQKWIALVGCDTPRILNNTFILKLNDHATSSVINGDASVVLAELGGNRIHMTGYSANLLSAVLMHASATGVHYDGRISGDVAALTSLNDFAGGYSSEVYCGRTVDKNGVLDPVVA